MKIAIRRTCCLCVALALSTHGGRVAAQARGSAPASPAAEVRSTTSFLPAAHWAVSAARRLHAAGLTPRGFDASSGVLTISQIHDVLVYAADRAQQTNFQEITASYVRRMEHDFPRLLASADDANPGFSYDGALAAGVTIIDGVQHVGAYDSAGTFRNPPEAKPYHGSGGETYVAMSPISHVALTGLASLSRSFEIREAELTIATNRVGIYGGRAMPGYRTTESGSVVLQGDVPFNGVGVYLTQPLYLPGIFRHVGPIGFESMLSRAERRETIDKPWFWTARGSLEPFRWMGFRITRAAYAGSLDPDKGLSPRDIARLLVGQNAVDEESSSYADNQVVAVDGWFRSLSPSVPLSFYWDWGADDSAGAWWRVAARVFGLRLAAIPGVPQASIGLEHIDIQGPNESHGPWYRHVLMPEGWSEDGVLLGHPIGGQGRETMIYGSADLFDSRLRMGARAYYGTRGIYNVFAPARAGDMHGFGVDATHSLSNRSEIVLRASTERGANWSQSFFTLRAGILF